MQRLVIIRSAEPQNLNMDSDMITTAVSQMTILNNLIQD